MTKNGIRTGAALLTLLALSKIPVRAADSVSPAPRDEPRAMEVTADGLFYPGPVILEDGTASVSLRAFSRFVRPCLGEDALTWDGECACLAEDELTIRAEVGSRVLEANGRMLWCAEEITNRDGTVYVPLRPLSAAFGYNCTYDPAARRAVLVRESESALAEGDAEPGLPGAREDDLFWLSRIIEAEAGAEPFEGKLAVGAVVLNRVDSDEFPSTVRDVIFDCKDGVQFTPAENGTIWGEPGPDSVLAARVTLDSPRLWDDIRYFINPAIAASLWVPAAREYAFTIGGHDFYR